VITGPEKAAPRESNRYEMSFPPRRFAFQSIAFCALVKVLLPVKKPSLTLGGARLHASAAEVKDTITSGAKARLKWSCNMHVQGVLHPTCRKEQNSS